MNQRICMGLAVLVGMSMAITGCNDDGDDPTGAGGTGGYPSGPWGCVGHVVCPPAPNETVTATWRFFHLSDALGDPADGAPFEGATVDVCGEGSDCSAPLDTGTTDSTGEVTLALPTPDIGFEGYLRAHGTELMTITYHFAPPIAEASSRWLAPDQRFALVLNDIFADFAVLLADVIVDPTKGTVITTTADCDGSFTNAAAVTVDGASADWAGGGDSVHFNVEPGPFELVATLADGTEVARVGRSVAAGQLTAVHLSPMPNP
jgi:hypothetical protein